MAKESADRYQSMAELKSALQAIGSHKSAVGLKPNLVATLQLMMLRLKAGKFRIPAWSYLIVGVILLGTAAYTAFYMGAFRAPMEQHWSDLYLRGQNQMNAGSYDEADRTLSDALSLARSSLALRRNVAPTLLQLHDLKGLVNDTAAQERLDKEYHAAIQEDVDASSNLIKELDGALAHATPGDSGTDREMDAQLCQDACDMVEMCLDQNRLEQGAQLSAKAVALASKTLDSPKYKSLGLSLYSKGTIAHRRRDFASAEQDYKQSIAFFTKNFSANEPAISKDWIGLGLLYSNEHEFDKALEAYTQAQQIRAQIYNSQSNEVAWVKTCRGECYLTMKNKERGIEELRQAKAIFEVMPNPIKADRARCWALLAWATGRKDDEDIALAVQQELLAQSKDYLTFLLNSIGDKSANPAPYWKRAFVICERVNCADADLIAGELAKLDRYYTSKNDQAAMKPLYLYEERTDRKLFGDDSMRVANDLIDQAFLARRLGNMSDAEKRYSEALSICNLPKNAQLRPRQRDMIDAALIELFLDQKQSGKAAGPFAELKENVGQDALSPNQLQIVTDSVQRYAASLKVPESSKVETAWRLALHH
jgi:tetratricopeptide (TPR) repeat protein